MCKESDSYVYLFHGVHFISGLIVTTVGVLLVSTDMPPLLMNH